MSLVQLTNSFGPHFPYLFQGPVIGLNKIIKKISALTSSVLTNVHIWFLKKLYMHIYYFLYILLIQSTDLQHTSNKK
jgi:hypothetical protein